MKRIVLTIGVLFAFLVGNSQIYTSKKDWFQKVAEGEISVYTYIEKFGENPEIATGTDPEDIWDYGGIYQFSTTADINKIASSNNGDTQEIIVYGLNANWNAITDTVTLTGQTVVTLDSTFLRVYRMINNSTTDLAGNVTMATTGTTWSNGVADQADSVRAYIVNGNNQTLMCVYTVPAGKTGYFWAGYVSVSSGGVSTQTAEFTWRARPLGGVFQVKSKIACAGDGSSWWNYTYKIPLALPEKTDVLIRCDEVSATMGVSGGFTVLLKDN